MFVSFNPQEPTNWRAVCGRTARAVSEGGEPQVNAAFLPLSLACRTSYGFESDSVDDIRSSALWLIRSEN